jgi:[ribosomal protein S5]-alanine N-acetyltransferase
VAEGETGRSRVFSRELAAADEDEFLGLARASVGLHHPWYTMPTTPEAFAAYLIRLSAPGAEGRLVRVRDSGAMAGVITIDSIIRVATRLLPCGFPGVSVKPSCPACLHVTS